MMREKKKSPSLFLTNELLNVFNQYEISFLQFYLFVLIKKKEQEDSDGICQLTQEQLATRLKVTPETVYRNMKVLEEKKLIRKIKQGPRKVYQTCV